MSSSPAGSKSFNLMYHASMTWANDNLPIRATRVGALVFVIWGGSSVGIAAGSLQSTNPHYLLSLCHETRHRLFRSFLAFRTGASRGGVAHQRAGPGTSTISDLMLWADASTGRVRAINRICRCSEQTLGYPYAIFSVSPSPSLSLSK